MADTPAQDRKAGLKRTQIGNRYLTAYDPHLALRIVEQIAEGELLRDICKQDGMPHRTTFMRWVAREPALREAYQGARELSALSMEEEALEHARAIRLSPGTSQAVRAAEVAINQLRWSASRRDPKTYGDRGVASTIVPVTIQTTLNLGEGKGQVSTEIPDIYTIDVTPKAPEPEQTLLPKGSRWKKVSLTPREAPDGA